MSFQATGWIVAALSLLFTVYVHFDRKRSERINLKVTFQNGMHTFADGGLSEPMLLLKVANIGSKKVTINAPNINVKHSDEGSLFTDFGSYQRMPYALEPGDSLVAWHEIKPLAKALKRHGLSGKIKLEGYFTSQVGDEYKARRPYNLDVNDWSKD